MRLDVDKWILIGCVPREREMVSYTLSAVADCFKLSEFGMQDMLYQIFSVKNFENDRYEN